MGSTRLPGKVLKKVLGKPLLEYQIERIRHATLIDDIVIATTTKEADKPIVNLCKKLSILYYRGSEEDVLSRYYEAALKFEADVVVRLTSDCPLIDPIVIDHVIRTFLNEKDKLDYVSNTIERTFPRGMDTEVFSFNALEKAFTCAKQSSFREHVTPFIYKNPNDFRLKNVKLNEDYSNYRLTVDTIEDFNLIKRVLASLYVESPVFKLEDLILFLRLNPDLEKINAHVEQKEIM